MLVTAAVWTSRGVAARAAPPLGVVSPPSDEGQGVTAPPARAEAPKPAGPPPPPTSARPMSSPATGRQPPKPSGRDVDNVPVVEVAEPAWSYRAHYEVGYAFGVRSGDGGSDSAPVSHRVLLGIGVLHRLEADRCGRQLGLQALGGGTFGEGVELGVGILFRRPLPSGRDLDLRLALLGGSDADDTGAPAVILRGGPGVGLGSSFAASVELEMFVRHSSGELGAGAFGSLMFENKGALIVTGIGAVIVGSLFLALVTSY